MFSLEKLKVYDRALNSTAGLLELAAAWDRRHAVVDHLVRASESVVLNIAEGARLRGTNHRLHVLDYAIGSALECAACLDIAVGKQFLAPEPGQSQKRSLSEVVRMLVGLRKSWSGEEWHEDAPPYGAEDQPLFGHERLEAYRVGLRFLGWFHALPGAPELSSRPFRQIDKAATSLVLNIAEGNGRRLEADRWTFFETAESAVVKAGAYLALSRRTGEVDASQGEEGMALLDRAALLVRGLRDFSRGA